MKSDGTVGQVPGGLGPRLPYDPSFCSLPVSLRQTDFQPLSPTLISVCSHPVPSTGLHVKVGGLCGVAEWWPKHYEFGTHPRSISLSERYGIKQQIKTPWHFKRETANENKKLFSCFWPESLHFHIAGGPTNYIAGLTHTFVLIIIMTTAVPWLKSINLFLSPEHPSIKSS